MFHHCGGSEERTPARKGARSRAAKFLNIPAKGRCGGGLKLPRANALILLKKIYNISHRRAILWALHCVIFFVYWVSALLQCSSANHLERGKDIDTSPGAEDHGDRSSEAIKSRLNALFVVIVVDVLPWCLGDFFGRGVG